jgi:formate dehydrogenase subunit delta
MPIDSLIRMANQIGLFFDAMPDRDEAIDGVADHLARFWDPRMRRELLAHVEAQTDARLNRIVAEAIERHRGTLV